MFKKILFLDGKIWRTFLPHIISHSVWDRDSALEWDSQKWSLSWLSAIFFANSASILVRTLKFVKALLPHSELGSAALKIYEVSKIIEYLLEHSEILFPKKRGGGLFFGFYFWLYLFLFLGQGVKRIRPKLRLLVKGIEFERSSFVSCFWWTIHKVTAENCELCEWCLHR